jgi:hypothetical protein
LGGVVYSVPVLGDSIHNLGLYLSEHEILFFARGAYSGQNNKSAILFSTEKPRVGLVDYLSFGKTYHEIYASSEYLQKTIDPEQLALLVKRNQLVVTQVKQYLLDMDANCLYTLEEFATFLAESPLIQMLYFELLLEFVYLFQNDAESHRSIDNFELYSNNAKQLIFTLNPELANGFSLKKITSPPDMVEAYLKQMSYEGTVIEDYKSGQFKSYLKSRLYEQLEFYFHDNRNLVGHVLFRCFNERRVFELQLAEILWEEAEQKNVQAVSYRMPKGEIGLLPGKYHTETGYIVGGEFIKQSISDLTVSRAFSSKVTGIMRNPYEANQ